MANLLHKCYRQFAKRSHNFGEVQKSWHYDAVETYWDRLAILESPLSGKLSWRGLMLFKAVGGLIVSKHFLFNFLTGVAAKKTGFDLGPKQAKPANLCKYEV
jgi:hypothetical protein